MKKTLQTVLVGLSACAGNLAYGQCTITDQNVLGSTEVCKGESAFMEVVGSEPGISYYLRNDIDDKVVDGPIAGTGFPLVFNSGPLMESSAFNVIAKKTTSALEYDGSGDNVEVSSLSINPADIPSMTVSAYVYINPNQSGSWGAVITNDNGGYDRALMHGTDNKWHIFAGRDVRTDIPIEYNKWLYVSAVWTASEVEFYIDDELLYATTGESISTGTAHSSIGGGAWDLNGKIDDLTVWDKRLSAAEIATNKTSCINAPMTNLVASYNFDENTGMTTADASGNNHTGALSGGMNTSDWTDGTTACGCELELTDKVNVEVKMPAMSSQEIRACESAVIHKMEYTESQIVIDTLGGAASNGCDSIVTTHLTIDELDLTVSQNGNELTAVESEATFQWLDCNNSHAAIDGKVDPLFVAELTGDYAVEVGKGTCLDTSECVNVMITSTDDELSTLQSGVYPNPTKGDISIELNDNLGAFDVEIRALTGEVISTYHYVNSSRINLELDSPKGIYMLTVKAESGESATYRIIKE